MSYDVCIGDFSLNTTWNLGKFFRTFIDPEGLHCLDTKTGSAAAKILAAAMRKLAGELNFNNGRTLSDKYSAPNGWGTWQDGFVFLTNLLEACLMHPRKIVRVYS